MSCSNTYGFTVILEFVVNYNLPLTRRSPLKIITVKFVTIFSINKVH